MQSVQQAIIALNTNFQKLHFENNSKFFSDILPKKIDEIVNLINQVHYKYPLPNGVDKFTALTNDEKKCIDEYVVRKDLNYWQKDFQLNACKIKMAECLLQFHNDCYYPGILSFII